VWISGSTRSAPIPESSGIPPARVGTIRASARSVELSKREAHDRAHGRSKIIAENFSLVRNWLGDRIEQVDRFDVLAEALGHGSIRPRTCRVGPGRAGQE